jgi:hypothetical protein
LVGEEDRHQCANEERERELERKRKEKKKIRNKKLPGDCICHCISYSIYSCPNIERPFVFFEEIDTAIPMVVDEVNKK